MILNILYIKYAVRRSQRSIRCYFGYNIADTKWQFTFDLRSNYSLNSIAHNSHKIHTHTIEQANKQYTGIETCFDWKEEYFSL